MARLYGEAMKRGMATHVDWDLAQETSDEGARNSGNVRNTHPFNGVCIWVCIWDDL